MYHTIFADQQGSRSREMGVWRRRDSFYSIAPRDQGGYYVVMHIGLGDGAAARAISSKVHETALL